MDKELATAAGATVPHTQEQNSSTESKCPVAHGASKFQTNAGWWPNQLNVNILHQHSPKSDPMGKEFNYAEAVSYTHLIFRGLCTKCAPRHASG